MVKKGIRFQLVGLIVRVIVFYTRWRDAYSRYISCSSSNRPKPSSLASNLEFSCDVLGDRPAGAIPAIRLILIITVIEIPERLERHSPALLIVYELWGTLNLGVDCWLLWSYCEMQYDEYDVPYGLILESTLPLVSCCVAFSRVDSLITTRILISPKEGTYLVWVVETDNDVRPVSSHCRISKVPSSSQSILQHGTSIDIIIFIIL